MARITISINAESETSDQDLVTLDLDLSLTLADLKSLVEIETKFPASSQEYFLDGQALRDNTKTLEQLNIKDGEMLAMMVSRAPQQQQRPGARRTTEQPGPDDENRIEQIRQQILSSPEHMSTLIRQAPDLAQVVNDGAAFRQKWMDRIVNENRMQQEHENQIRLLNDDPFNAEAQRKIADIIRRENIEKNLQYAYENNPAVFVNVTMLYVPVLVNGQPIKAFVDSGAQTTIMSPSCAEACGISHLIDERYSGIAKGVGTAKIIGKVHNAKIQVGDAELDCAFTVMEGKDVDLLFGLDMLRRHQACIDLRANKLRFQHTEIDFLPENEIPKGEERRMLDEPTVQGPNGTEIGTRSGTVRPEGTAAAAQQSLKNAKKTGEEKAPLTSSGTPSGAAGASSTTGTSGTTVASGASAPPTAQTTTGRYPEASITQLTHLGFSREEAIGALDATGGNVEYAAGLLFGQM